MLLAAVAAVDHDAPDVVRTQCGFEFGQLGQIGGYLTTILLGQWFDRIQILQQARRIVRVTQERVERSTVRVRSRVVGRHLSKVTPHGHLVTTDCEVQPLN